MIFKIVISACFWKNCVHFGHCNKNQDDLWKFLTKAHLKISLPINKRHATSNSSKKHTFFTCQLFVYNFGVNANYWDDVTTVIKSESGCVEKNALIRGSPAFSQAYLLFVNRDRALVKLDISSFIQLITIQARTISNQVLNRPPHCAIMFLLTRKTF